MPVMDGIEATRRLAGGPRVLVLTTFDLDDYVYDALDAGASGFLLKDTPAETLFDAVRVVAAGEALLAPSVTRRLIDEFARRSPRPTGRLDALTPRETDVLRLIAAGLSNAEIAAQLVVSDETVKTHVSRVLIKLDLRDRTQAVVLAYESGLVVPRAGVDCAAWNATSTGGWVPRGRARRPDRGRHDRLRDRRGPATSTRSSGPSTPWRPPARSRRRTTPRARSSRSCSPSSASARCSTARDGDRARS